MHGRWQLPVGESLGKIQNENGCHTEKKINSVPIVERKMCLTNLYLNFFRENTKKTP